MMLSKKKTADVLVKMKKWFAKDSRPVSMKEFKDFWSSCSDLDRTEFKEYINSL